MSLLFLILSLSLATLISTISFFFQSFERKTIRGRSKEFQRVERRDDPCVSYLRTLRRHNTSRYSLFNKKQYYKYVINIFLGAFHNDL